MFALFGRVGGLLWKLVSGVFSFLFGNMTWSCPPWASWVGGRLAAMVRWLKSRPAMALLLLVLLTGIGVGGYYGHQWWKNRPQPTAVKVSVTTPKATDPAEQLPPSPLIIEFSASVAPLPEVGKETRPLLSLDPSLPGVWRWKDERTLEFQPQEEWPLGEKYQVEFKSKFVPEHMHLTKASFDFQAPAFTARVVKSEFYQDPVNAGVKKAVFDLEFSHPVQIKDFEKSIALSMQNQSGAALGGPVKFTVNYDKLHMHAYVHSEPLPIPTETGVLQLKVASGVQAARGGKALASELKQTVAIPGLNNLTIESMEFKVVDNERNEPEQILFITSSMAVHEKDMAKAVSAWVLPRLHPEAVRNNSDGSAYAWADNDVTPAILKASEKLKLDALPAEREYTEGHSFRYRADVGRYVYVLVEKSITSFGGYKLGNRYAQLSTVPAFPAALEILSEGSLLPLSGEKKVAVRVRDLPGLKYGVGRVLPGQLQHLVSQGGSSFSRPEFYGDFGADNLVERFEREISLHLEPGKTHYEAIDLGEYLHADGKSRRGIFLLNVKQFDPQTQSIANAAPSEEGGDEAYAEEGDGGSEGYSEDSESSDMKDSRLVVVTDLGILVKKSADGSQDVFVQSIHSGDPVAGATVDVIGKNGLTLVSHVTDVTGRAHFEKLEGFARERAPLMVLVTSGEDMSFLPLGKSERGLDFSRFDVGGIDNARSAGQLSAYLFSDRGIYRPGERFHIGMIIKAADWGKPIVGVPLEAEVVDARGLVVKRETIKVAAGGFNELQYRTLDSSPTGTYAINLYIVRDGQASEQIGSTTVRVQEFLPDRMRVKAALSREAAEGWVAPADLRATVSAMNLFGTAAENRRVEASMILSPAFPAFRTYPDYVFYDPYRAKEGYSEQLEDGQTDANGTAEFNLGLERYAKATYRMRFQARVFEPEGGRGVSAETAVLVSEMPFLVGFKADGDLSHVSRATKREVALVAIDPAAKRTAVNDLQLQLLERKVVSVLTRQNSGVYKYESRRKETLVNENKLNIASNATSLTLATDTPGDFVYVIRNAEGLELNRIEYSVAGMGNVSRSLERNAELQLTLNKKDYQPGESIEVSIRAPYTGAGLITIEREKVYGWQWFKANTTASVQKILLPRDFEGNGYISVQFIRDPGSDEIFTSPLSYGVVPFATSLSARTNEIKLAVPELVRPGQKVPIRLTCAKPSRAVVYAVDEGILQVARYKLPDPLGFFFQKRRLEVSTAQILDLILPEFRKLMAAAAPGGDDDGALGRRLNPFKRRQDQPAVYWSGIVDVKDSMEFNCTVPETFNGNLKIMAVGVGNGTVGVIQTSTLVRGDFVISPNAPLAVAPGDEFDVSVGLSNNVKGSGVSPAIALELKSSAHFEMVGNATRMVTVGEMREGVASFRVKARSGSGALLGSGSLVFTASLDDKKSRLATSVSVRPASPFETALRVGSFTGNVELPVSRNMHPEFRQAEVAVSPLPLVAATGLTAYLGNFNHACTEQLVSQAIPPLVLTGRPEFGTGKGSVPGKSLASVITVLRTRQNAEGGFGLWSASVEPNEFVSVYATQLLIEAKERGIGVQADMTKLALSYLEQLAASHGESLADVRVRLYAAYLLTRQGMVTTSLLAGQRETLEQNYAKEWQGDLAAAYLAASYQLLKQEKQAGELIAPLAAALGKRTKDFGFANYYDPLVHDSQLIYLLAKHFPPRLKSLTPDVALKMMAPLEQGRVCTLSAASMVLALDAWATVAGTQVTGDLGLYELAGNGTRKDLPVVAKTILARAPFSADAAKLGVVAGSDQPHFYAATEGGYDREPAKTELKQGMEVFREYLDAKGNPVQSVELGDEVTVRIRVRGLTRSIGNVAVVDMLPGGLEPVLVAPPSPDDDAVEGEVEEKAPDRLGGAGSWAGEYLDVREDRVVLYGRVNTDMSEYTYKARAIAAGTFVVPPAYAESLYERDLKARAAAAQLTVQNKK